MTNNKDIIDFLIENVNIKKTRLLIKSTQINSIKLVKLILETGANVNIRDEYDYTAGSDPVICCI